MPRKLAILTLVAGLVLTAATPVSAEPSKGREGGALEAVWSLLVGWLAPQTAVEPGRVAGNSEVASGSQSSCRPGSVDQMSTIDPFGNPVC